MEEKKMANQTLFSTSPARRAKPANTKNKAGGRAYKLSDAETLAQYVVTSCFNDVYYASAREQLDKVKEVCGNVQPELIAKAAVYGHETGGMKDVPAFLLATLAANGEIDLLRKAFPRVIRNPKMLLNFVQIIRSGVTGRKSFGSAVKNLINDWITSRYGNKLFLASVGYSNPSLVDTIKMTHPRPKSEEQNALFGYLLGKDYNAEALPPLVKEFEAFKADNSNPLPDMDYRALTNCDLTKEHWKRIAENMPWNTLRMNLNVLQRNGVFEDSLITQRVASTLSDPNQVRQWNVFPYQLLTTFNNVSGVPNKVRLALQDAMEVATENVPVLGDRIAVCVDVSGSMGSAVTGNRGSVTSATRCIDVASLIASAIARTNPEADIISFGTNGRMVPNFNPRDSVMTNSHKLASEGNAVGHGTNASAAMQVVANQKKKYDFIIFVSDMQSWIDGGIRWGAPGLTQMWENYKRKNKGSKIAEINLQPYGDSQLNHSDPSVMNIGGFSDAVFDVLNEFAHRDDNVKFLDVIEKVEL
jgi:60 kDa SS-A/Ro ribonucleoprotein